MRFVWTGDERFVPDGEQIYMTTVEPAFSWNVFDNPKYDFVDYGIGAGFFWIGSKEFPTSSGGFLEPVRLDFHRALECSESLEDVHRQDWPSRLSGRFSAGRVSTAVASSEHEDLTRRRECPFGFYIDTDYLHKRKSSK